jgi:hypothetical protein
MSLSVSLPCPHCGLSFRLNSEYLSQFGGAVTICTGCGQKFTLPAVSDVFGGTESPSVPAADSNPSVIHYASAQHPPTPVWTDGIWRDGACVVIRRGARLPHRCIRCNAPGDGPQVWVRLWWQEEEILFRASLCESHSAIRARNTRLGSPLILAGVCLIVAVLVVVVASSTFKWVMYLIGFAVAAALIVAGLVFRYVGGAHLTLQSITPEAGWVTGFCADFVGSLPAIEQARSAEANDVSRKLEHVVHSES